MFSSVVYALFVAAVLVISSHPTNGRRKSSPVKAGHLLYGEPIGGWKFSEGNWDFLSSSTKFPYMIEVKHPLIEVCGGALIKDNAAITARHCLDVVETNDTNTEVKAGHLFRNDDTSPDIQKRKVKNIFRYSRIDESDENDLAILQLVSPFRLTDFVNTIGIPSKRNEYVREIGILLGWGITESGLVSQVLRKISLRVLTDKHCAKLINATVSPVNHFLCGMHDNTTSVVCGGDSGGPFVIHNENHPNQDMLIGILSFSYDNDDDFCDSLKPSVTMDIAYYRTWIMSILEMF